MVNPLFTYIPSDAVAIAPNTPTTPIYITTTNVAFTPIIPDSLQDQGLEPYLQFIQSHPLRYAFTEIPLFLPQHICEFYYSCTYDPTAHTLNGTIADGQQPVTISPSTIRNALRLPIFNEYPPHPTDTECRTSLPVIGYNLALQGTRSEKFVLRQCLPAGWKLITGIIGKCLTQKTGSLDQLNLFELRILHALVADRLFDFAGLIFDHFVETISGRTRPQYVTFPRFIGLILEHLGAGYAGDIGSDMRCPTSSPRLFSAAPQPGDPPVFPHMLNWINHPYSADPRPTDFVPLIVEPLAQQAGSEAQLTGSTQPIASPSSQPAGNDPGTGAQLSTSPSDQQPPQHQSPQQQHRSPTPQSPINIESGNTESIHFSNSEAATSFSHPSSESPLLNVPPILHILPQPTPAPRPPSQGESHKTIPTRASPVPQATQATQPEGQSTDFQSTVLQLLTTMNQRLHILESDVAAIKNHLIPSPQANPHTTPPPPPPPPSHPSPNDKHVSDSSSSQSDAAKGENTAEGESQQKQAQAEGEQSKKLAEDSFSSSSDDEEGFLDTSFLQEDLLPLVTGELSDVEEDAEGSLQPRKRKKADAESSDTDPSGAGFSTAGPSSAAGPSSPPKKKRRTVEELAADWGMSIEKVRELSTEHVAALHNIAIESADADVVRKIAAEEGGEASQLEVLHSFEAAAAKKHKISKVLDRMDAKRYADVQHKRHNPDPITKVRCTKPQQEKRLKLHITRTGGPVGQYTETLYASELQKYGLSEWLQIQNIIATHKGIHAQELKVALNQLIEKCQRLKLIPAPSSKSPSAGTSSAAPRRSKSKHIPFLLPYGTRYINNTLPAGVEPVQYKFIRQPEHGMFYMDANFQMCFQRTSDLSAAQTEHLYHLRLECMGHPEQEGFYKIISVELEERSAELLAHEEMYWMKDEILSDAEKARLEALVD